MHDKQYIDEALAYLQHHGARVEYDPAFFSAAEADAYLQRLLATVEF